MPSMSYHIFCSPMDFILSLVRWIFYSDFTKKNIIEIYTWKFLKDFLLHSANNSIQKLGKNALNLLFRKLMKKKREEKNWRIYRSFALNVIPLYVGWCL